jgi:hypothetical protein
MDYQLHNFKTSVALQKRLAIKRESLGYKEFYSRVDTALSPTMKSVNVTNEILFGRRYQDDIFWSIQIRYPDVTMDDIRKIADILCV